MGRLRLGLLGVVALGVGGGCGPQSPPAAEPSQDGPGPSSPGRRGGVNVSGADEVAPIQAIGAPPPGQECSADEDCGLLPRFSCCGDCPPAPPYQALPHAAIEGMAKDEDDQCAAERHDCSRHRCSEPPQGCSARPVCRKGACDAELSEACRE